MLHLRGCVVLVSWVTKGGWRQHWRVSWCGCPAGYYTGERDRDRTLGWGRWCISAEAGWTAGETLDNAQEADILGGQTLSSSLSWASLERKASPARRCRRWGQKSNEYWPTSKRIPPFPRLASSYVRHRFAHPIPPLNLLILCPLHHPLVATRNDEPPRSSQLASSSVFSVHRVQITWFWQVDGSSLALIQNSNTTDANPDLP